jgi:cytoskeletal protein CcmA (bactofilin family)
MAEEQKKQPENTPPPEPESTSADSDSLEGPATADTLEPASGNSAPALGAQPPAASEKVDTSSPADNLKNSFNIYFIIFIVVVIASIGIILFAVNSSKKTAKTTTTKTPTLTSQQLASLKGNTTLVGDAKTTLDIQSNAVFEGQVLVRSDLSVAGAIKIGGSLSIPSINVGNEATVHSLQVGDTAGINGNATIQGTLTVQKSLSVAGGASFGNLSVGSLSVSSLQISGDLAITRHIVTNGTSVNRTPGSALGGGGTVSVSGTDTAGTVVINTGGSPAAGVFATINFAQKFGTVPKVIISPVGAAAGSVTYYVTRDATGFSIGCSTPPPAGASFSFDYFVIN